MVTMTVHQRPLMTQDGAGLYAGPMPNPAIAGNPKLNPFYEASVKEFKSIYNAHNEVMSWMYFSRDHMWVITAAGVALLAVLGDNILNQAKKLVSGTAGKEDNDHLVERLTTFLKIPLKVWKADTLSFSAAIKPVSVIVSTYIAVHKINSILELRRKSSNFLTYFPHGSDPARKLVLDNAAKNIAEYMTFRFQGTILRLPDDIEIERFSKFVLKNLNEALTQESNPGHLAIEDEIIKAMFKEALKTNNLWQKTRCCGFCAGDKTIKLEEKGNVKELSYRKIFFNAPIVIVDSDGSQKRYDQPRDKWETDASLPAQCVTQQRDLVRMGFSFDPKKPIMPSPAKL